MAAAFRFMLLLPRGFATTSGSIPLHSAAMRSLPPSHSSSSHAPAPPGHVYICEFWLFLQLLPFVNMPFTFGNAPYSYLWGIFLTLRIWFHVEQVPLRLHLQLFPLPFVNYICEICSLMAFVKTHWRSQCPVQLGRTAPHLLSQSHPISSTPAAYPSLPVWRVLQRFP